MITGVVGAVVRAESTAVLPFAGVAARLASRRSGGIVFETGKLSTAKSRGVTNASPPWINVSVEFVEAVARVFAEAGTAVLAGFVFVE